LINGIFVPEVLHVAIVAVGVGLDVMIGVREGSTVFEGVGVIDGVKVGVWVKVSVGEIVPVIVGELVKNGVHVGEFVEVEVGVGVHV